MSGVIVPAGRLEDSAFVNIATRWFTRRAAAGIEVERKLEDPCAGKCVRLPAARAPRRAAFCAAQRIWITSCSVAFVALAALAWVMSN